MASSGLSSHHASSTSSDLPILNSYGSLPRSCDIEVLTSTSLIHPTNFDADQTHSAMPSQYRSSKTPCLKPHQSETIFAIFLFILGLSLLLYVIISYWLTHSQISPFIIFICGLLCFIPGVYYLIEHYCFCLRCQRNRLRRLPILDHDDII
jgi:hypothetical protein